MEGLVAWVLDQVLVRNHIRRRDGVQVVVNGGRCAKLLTAFEGPEVGTARELAEANQVRAAVALAIQLTRTLVQNRGQVQGGHIVVAVAVGALANHIEVAHALRQIGARARRTFGIH